MTDSIVEEFLTVGDYCKVYDFLKMNKREFLDFYSYINNESYELSFRVAMQPSFLANLFRQAENLFQLETEYCKEDIDYMQETGTDYMSSADWKWLVTRFIANNYTKEQYEEFNEICQSMGV